MRAVTALSFALAVVAALALGGCSWLTVLAAGLEDAGYAHTTPPGVDELDDAGSPRDAADPAGDGGPDGGAPDDAGEALDASSPLDAGHDDEGELDGGDEEDAGGEDAFDHDAGSEDAGLDAGEPPVPDAGPLDPGPVSPAIVLAEGSGLGSANVQLDADQLAAVDTVLLFVAREQDEKVNVPGDWSGNIREDRGSNNERVAGVTRYFKKEPSTLSTSFALEVKDNERFSYALIGVTGLGTPDDTETTDDDTESDAICDDGPATEHQVQPSYDAYGVVGVAHRRPPATVPPPGRLLVLVEGDEGPSLVVHERAGSSGQELNLQVCLGGAGPFVSLAQGFRLQ